MKFSYLLFRNVPRSISKLGSYAEYAPSALTLKKILDFGRTAKPDDSYYFLRKELLVRLANIMQEINCLPGQLLVMPSVKVVSGWYKDSFDELLKYEEQPADEKVLESFATNLQLILDRHKSVVETMAEGLIELKTTHGVDVVVERNLQYFLDRFYINRVSIRMLIYQHVLVFSGAHDKGSMDPALVGTIDPECNVVEIIKHAYEDARYLCDQNYLNAPKLELEFVNYVQKSANSPIILVYVPSHLHHIMFELFKNAMRAVVEYHGEDADLPPLKVLAVKGNEDLSIKVSDMGGGFSRTIGEMFFNYLYTTAPPPDRNAMNPPMAGLGYGLPLSRLYARYFQGDIKLVSMDGYGTDALVYLKTLSSQAHEVIPIYSSAAKLQYRRHSHASDWSHTFNGINF